MTQIFGRGEMPMTWRAAILSLVIVNAAGCAVPILRNDAFREMEDVRSVELSRLQALVSADMPTAEQLHATDFHLITPTGRALSKAEYLGSVTSGEMDYISWKPGEIEVRLQGPMAAIRYPWRAEMIFRGRNLGALQGWSTGLYERRNGSWRIVWYQATRSDQPIN
jgi:hypothetical protein